MSLPSTLNEPDSDAQVLRVADIGADDLIRLLGAAGLELICVDTDQAIPGTFWGEPEAGLIGSTLYYREDTPVHSVLHEGCHFLCMSPQRRAKLNTNAGGTVQEENAVCYLQILLADRVPGLGRDRLMADMDAWGYSFRLGSAHRWFEKDAEDAKAWLLTRGLIPLKTDRSIAPHAPGDRHSSKH